MTGLSQPKSFSDCHSVLNERQESMTSRLSANVRVVGVYRTLN